MMINGSCNKSSHPQVGAAGHELLRLLPPTYSDGRGLPRAARGLPGARKISASLHHESGDPKSNVLKADTTPDRSHTHLLMEFGHFLAHDVSLTSQAELDCCSPEVLVLESELPDSLKRCFNIDVSRDRFYSSAGRSCHSFTRSDARCLAASGSNVREQFNSVTAWVDGSALYGSDVDTTRGLRAHRDGLLKTHLRIESPSLPTRGQCGFSSPPPQHSGGL